MEEEKRKNKNSKKKKNKLNNKTTENSGVGSGEFISPSQVHHLPTATGKSTSGQVDYTTTEARDGGIVSRIVADRDSHLPKDAQGITLDSFEETIKQFQEEKDAYAHKEVILEEKIKKLQFEKDVSLQKEASLLEKIEELESEKAAHMQKEASLGKQILNLGNEIYAYRQKEAGLEKKITELHMEVEAHLQQESALEAKIEQLQIDKESRFQKEVQFEEKINHLVDEAATLSLKNVSLEEMVKQMERERDSWILQESTTKEVIGSLNGDKSRLQAQVVELQELRNSLLQEKQLLTETVSGLQSQIVNLERAAASSQSSTQNKMHTTEKGDVASQTDAARALVEKLITENAELVEKVNELYIELNCKSLLHETSLADGSAGVAKSVHVADSSAVGLHLMVGATETPKTAPASDSLNEASAKMLVSGIRVQSLEDDDPKNDKRSNGEYLDDKNTVLFSDSSEIIESDEIVQIPLDENERELTDVEAANNVEKTEVPLSDAPFVGAPFRLISFVARYVSGADLVEKNSVNSGG